MSLGPSAPSPSEDCEEGAKFNGGGEVGEESSSGEMRGGLGQDWGGRKSWESPHCFPIGGGGQLGGVVAPPSQSCDQKPTEAGGRKIPTNLHS